MLSTPNRLHSASRLLALPGNISRAICKVSVTLPAMVWKAGLPFYLGTGLIALSQYAERFLIADLEPYASLGKYVYAWSAANTLQALSYAVVAVVGIAVRTIGHGLI